MLYADQNRRDEKTTDQPIVEDTSSEQSQSKLDSKWHDKDVLDQTRAEDKVPEQTGAKVRHATTPEKGPEQEQSEWNRIEMQGFL